MNNIKLTGFFNHIKEIGEKTKIASFSYNFKTKDKEFKNIFVEVYLPKEIDIKEKERYIITGFLVGDIWIDKKTGKERNILKIRINKVEKLKNKKDYKNFFEIKGYVSNLKKISDKISTFRLSYPIKMKDNSTKYIYVDAIIQNNKEIKEKENYFFEGFFTGNYWINKENKEIKKIELYCSNVKSK